VEGITVEVLSQAELDVRTEGRAGATLDRLTPEEMDELRDNVSNVVDVIQSLGSPRIRITEYGPQGFPLGFCMRWQRGRPPTLPTTPPPETVEGMSQGLSGGCQSMLIVLDGRPVPSGPMQPASSFIMEMDPEDIESVEVLSPVQAQFRFGQLGANGALVIDTRRGGREGEQEAAESGGRDKS
jgi:hypothetical protein